MQNLFDFFGADVEVTPLEQKAKKTKGESTKNVFSKGTKEKTKERKKEAVKKETYEAPITIYTGFADPLILEAHSFQEGEAITLDVIRAMVVAKFQEFTPDLLVLTPVKEKKGAFLGTFNPKHKVVKGSVTLSETSRLSLGKYEYDLSTLMTDATCTVDVAEIKKLVFERTPIKDEKVSIYQDQEVLVLGLEKGNRPPVLKEFPIKIAPFGRDMFFVTEEMYQEEVKGEESKQILLPVVERILYKHYPEFQYGKVITPLDDNRFCVTLEVLSKPSVPTKVLYPTDAIISLIWQKLPLSPDLFGGKEEVEEKDILSYLGKDYPEYSKERTTLSFDKKKKLIIPILKGSTKGAEIVEDETRMEELLKAPYAMFYYQDKKKGSTYRVEKKPEGLYVAEKNGTGDGMFTFYLPAVPEALYIEMECFFSRIMKLYDTEAMVQLFWNPQEKCYFLHYPKQFCGHTYVNCERDHILESTHILVADFHSHGRINCSFSGVDNTDEKGTRLYGVFYELDQSTSSFDIRMGCGGDFVSLAKDVIFESCSLSEVDKEKIREKVEKQPLFFLTTEEGPHATARPSFWQEHSDLKDANLFLGNILLIPHGVTTLDTGAFLSLQKVDTVIVPGSLQEIRVGAFASSDIKTVIFTHTSKEPCRVHLGALRKEQEVFVYNKELKAQLEEIHRGPITQRGYDGDTGRELQVSYTEYGIPYTLRCHLTELMEDAPDYCDLAVDWTQFDSSGKEVDGGIFEHVSQNGGVPVIEEYIRVLLEHIHWNDLFLNLQIMSVEAYEE